MESTWRLYKSKKGDFAIMARELDQEVEVVNVRWDHEKGAWVPTVFGP